MVGGGLPLWGTVLELRAVLAVWVTGDTGVLVRGDLIGDNISLILVLGGEMERWIIHLLSV